MKSIAIRSSRRLWINLLLLAVAVGALALAPESDASDMLVQCRDAGCTGWECINYQYNQCVQYQNCCACTCGSTVCSYFTPRNTA